MRNEVAEDLKNSLAAFEITVWPAIKHLCGAPEIRHLENSEHPTDRDLDVLAGIDGYTIEGLGMRGIASRIQPSVKSWDTFTIRLSREGGAVTEYEKRLTAIRSDGRLLYPHLTIQAYTNPVTRELVAAAMVRTKDLIEHADACKAEHRTWSGHQDTRCYTRETCDRGRATFLVVPWAHLESKGVQVGIVRAAANGNV